jgi:hypothetical protein
MENKKMNALLNSYKQGFLIITIALFIQFVIISFTFSKLDDVWRSNGPINQSVIYDLKEYIIPIGKGFSFLCVASILFGFIVLFNSTSTFLNAKEESHTP